MSDKAFLRITDKGFAGYTGELSYYSFVDGVSVEPIPATERDRISASISCEEFDPESGDSDIAGMAHRLVAESEKRAIVRPEFKRQTEDEKVEEQVAIVKKAFAETKTIYTQEELEQIADKSGIAGLREVVANEGWNVKNRSIPTLAQMILDAQAEYMSQNADKISKKANAMKGKLKPESGDFVSVGESVVDRPKPKAKPKTKPESKPELKPVEKPKAASAAETGDISAMINQVSSGQSSDPFDGDDGDDLDIDEPLNMGRG